MLRKLFRFCSFLGVFKVFGIRILMSWKIIHFFEGRVHVMKREKLFIEKSKICMKGLFLSSGLLKFDALIYSSL